MSGSRQKYEKNIGPGIAETKKAVYLCPIIHEKISVVKNFSGNFQINGFTDGHHECDRCGKSELKGVYHITTEQGQDFYLGSSCIKSAWQMSDKEFEGKWFATYRQRLSMARDEYFRIAEYEKDRAVCDAARKAAALKYGIKHPYEL